MALERFFNSEKKIQEKQMKEQKMIAERIYAAKKREKSRYGITLTPQIDGSSYNSKKLSEDFLIHLKIKDAPKGYVKPEKIAIYKEGSGIPQEYMYTSPQKPEKDEPLLDLSEEQPKVTTNGQHIEVKDELLGKEVPQEVPPEPKKPEVIYPEAKPLPEEVMAVYSNAPRPKEKPEVKSPELNIKEQAEHRLRTLREELMKDAPVSEGESVPKPVTVIQDTVAPTPEKPFIMENKNEVSTPVPVKEKKGFFKSIYSWFTSKRKPKEAVSVPVQQIEEKHHESFKLSRQEDVIEHEASFAPSITKQVERTPAEAQALEALQNGIEDEEEVVEEEPAMPIATALHSNGNGEKIPSLHTNGSVSTKREYQPIPASSETLVADDSSELETEQAAVSVAEQEEPATEGRFDSLTRLQTIQELNEYFSSVNRRASRLKLSGDEQWHQGELMEKLVDHLAETEGSSTREVAYFRAKVDQDMKDAMTQRVLDVVDHRQKIDEPVLIQKLEELIQTPIIGSTVGEEAQEYVLKNLRGVIDFRRRQGLRPGDKETNAIITKVVKKYS